MRIERGRDFEQRSQQIKMLGAAVEFVSEILDGASPVHIGEQPIVSQAHALKQRGRGDIKYLLERCSSCARDRWFVATTRRR